MKPIMLVSLCVQMAQDTATQLFNCEEVRKKCIDKKADILETNECFRKMFTAIRKSLTTEEWNDYVQNLDTRCERYSHVTSGIYNYFLNQCVKKFKYSDCETLALSMSVFTFLNTANSLFTRCFDGRCLYIEKIIEAMDSFAKHWRINGFHGVDSTLDCNGVKSILKNFIETALKE